MRTFTPAERSRRTVLLARGAKQALADAVDPRLEAELDRIDRSAADRWAREATAALRLLEKAKDDLAHAKAVERAAPRKDHPAARAARKRAEQRVRDTERAARKYR